jgi:hypothetical protein
MPKKDRAHRSKSPDSRNESESSQFELKASDAESNEGSSDEATPASQPMNPSIDIKVTMEIRHAKASKSGLTVATTTTPGKLSFYHSISFWASQIKETRRLIETIPPYKWACKANALELTFPKVYYQTKGGNEANIWIRVDQHKPNRYRPIPMEDPTGHYNIKVSFEADFNPIPKSTKQENETTNPSNQVEPPKTSTNQTTKTEDPPTKSSVTAEIIKIAKEEAIEV